MASLSEVYERKRGGGSHVSPRRALAGVGLFSVGALMIVVGLVVASTEILGTVGVGRFESRRIAGVVGGLGVPAVFVGILTVLPASDRVRAAATVGAAVAVAGVALFWLVYPSQWLGAGVDRHYTFETTTVYFLGTLVTFWCFFVAAANFKTRNDPGGTVELAVRKEGRTRIIEVDRSAIRSGLGGIGLLGGPSPPSQPAAVSDGGHTDAVVTEPGSSSSGAAPATATAADAGDDSTVIRADAADPVVPPVDRYCGNCRHFEYVRDGSAIRPYCGFSLETMDDMQPCEEWAPNRSPAATE